MLPALAFYLFSGITLVSAVMVVSARNPVHAVFFLILAFFSTAGLFILCEAEFLAMILIVVYVGAVAVLFLFVVMILNVPVPSMKTWFIPRLKDLVFVLSKIAAYSTIFLSAAYLFIAASSFSINYAFGISLINSSAFILNPLQQTSFIFTSLGNKTITDVGLIFLTIVTALCVGRKLAMISIRSNFLNLSNELMSQAPVGLIIVISLAAELVTAILVWGDTDEAAEMSLVPIPPAAILPNTHALGQYLYTDYLYIFQTSGLILLVAMIAAIILTQRRRPWVRKQNISEQVNRRRSDAVELKKVKVGEGVSKWG